MPRPRREPWRESAAGWREDPTTDPPLPGTPTGRYTGAGASAEGALPRLFPDGIGGAIAIHSSLTGDGAASARSLSRWLILGLKAESARVAPRCPRTTRGRSVFPRAGCCGTICFGHSFRGWELFYLASDRKRNLRVADATIGHFCLLPSASLRLPPPEDDLPLLEVRLEVLL